MMDNSRSKSKQLSEVSETGFNLAINNKWHFSTTQYKYIP